MIEIAGLAAVVDDVIGPAVAAGPNRRQTGLLVGRPAPDGELPMITGAVPVSVSDARPADGDPVVGWFAVRPGGRAAPPATGAHGQGSVVLVLDPRSAAEAVYVYGADGPVRLPHRPLLAHDRKPPSLLGAHADLPLLATMLAAGAVVGFAAWHVVA
jgi:hypothetical protein